MSGDRFHFGDNVNMHGGSGNTGIVKHQAAPDGSPGAPPALQEAVQELLQLLASLREQLPAASAQALDDALPQVTADPTVPAEERHRALFAVAGIASTIGTLGQPIVDAVNNILGLLSAR